MQLRLFFKTFGLREMPLTWDFRLKLSSSFVPPIMSLIWVLNSYPCSRIRFLIILSFDWMDESGVFILCKILFILKSIWEEMSMKVETFEQLGHLY